MYKHRIIYVISISFILLTLPASADWLNITPSKDSYVYEWTNDNTNYGSAATMEVGARFREGWVPGTADELQSLIYFDLGALPNGITINEATLRVNEVNTNGGGSAISDIKYITGTWNELGVTWNNKPASGSVINTVNLNSNGWKSAIVTNAVRGFINGTSTNYGFYIQTQVINDHEYSAIGTKESANIPSLNISYSITLYSPVNGSTQIKTYPPLVTPINFTWSNYSIYNSNLIVAKDIYFNLIAVDTITANNYSIQPLDAGNYWWKVRYYNSTSGIYGNWSDTFNFTLQATQTAANNSIQGTVYEIVGGAVTLISGADVFIYNATYSTSQRTGTNGYYLFQGLSGTYNIYATKQGYDTTVALPVTASANSSVINNILMKIYISSYVPNFVFERFIVRNLFDTPYPGVTITVYKGDDLTASFTGMTDSIGQAVFQLIKDQKYRITLSGGGISGTLTFTVYGKEEDYIIRIAGGFPTGGNRYTDINATLTSSTVNATHSNLSLIYRDNRSSTTAINFYATNLSTNSTCTQSSTSQNVTLSCTVLASGTYQFGFNATSSIYGFFQQDRIINFGAGKPASPSLAVPGVSSTYLHWISIMLIVLTASLFSVKTVKYGAVVIPSVAMIFWAVGWLQISFLLVSTALVIGVLVYSRMSETKVVYS